MPNPAPGNTAHLVEALARLVYALGRTMPRDELRQITKLTDDQLDQLEQAGWRLS